MSITGIRILCESPVAGIDETTMEAFYSVNYRFVPPGEGGHLNGGVNVYVNGYTDTEFNAVIQQAVVSHANLDFPGNDFTEADVIGGETLMAHQAKIFARLFDYSANPDMPDGSLRVTIEWKRLTGTRVGGKAAFVIEDIGSDDKMRSDLKDALADYLSDKFAPEVFRPRDIVGYSV